MTLTKEMLRDRMKETNVFVLNVLPEDDYLKLRIKGSYNIPLTQDRDSFVMDVETRFGKGMFLVTYGADGVCAAALNAEKLLKKNGFKVDFYPGGLREWDEAGFPTEGIRPGPKKTNRGSTLSKVSR